MTEAIAEAVLASADGEDSLTLLDEVALGSARGGKIIPEPLTCEVVRVLTPEDLPGLVAPPPVGSALPGLVQIRHAHHQLAQLLAAGDEQEKISLITGYSTSYISNIQGDPAFANLLAYYQTQREQIFHDTMQRMQGLGLSTLDELQARLAESPTSWSNRELMELAELTLVKGQGRAGGPGGNSAPTQGVTVNVKFVAAQAQPSGPVIDQDGEDA